MPNPHVDDKKGKKSWYIRGGKTEEKEGGKNRKNCVLTSDNTRAYPRILFVLI